MGSSLASRLAFFHPEEYAYYFEDAMDLLLLAENDEANKKHFQFLAIVVWHCHEDKVLGTTYFSKQENLEKLLKLAGVDTDLNFGLKIFDFKNDHLYKSDKRVPTAVAEQLITEFSALPPEPDNHRYVQSKTALYGYYESVIILMAGMQFVVMLTRHPHIQIYWLLLKIL